MSDKSNKLSIWRFICLSIIGILTIMFSNVAMGLDETVSLDVGDWYYVKLTGIGGYTIIDVNANVLSGGSIDVYLMDSLDYVSYSQDKGFDYYITGSAKDVLRKKYSFMVPTTGDYYLVIDNTNIGTKSSGYVRVNIVVGTRTESSDNQGIFDNANRLYEDYNWKVDLVTEIQRRTDALGTSATKEMYIEWKRRNNEAIDAGERLGIYLTENRNVLDEKGTTKNWASDKLILIGKNKVTLERDNQNLEQIINSFDDSPKSSGFGAIIALIAIMALILWRK